MLRRLSSWSRRHCSIGTQHSLFHAAPGHNLRPLLQRGIKKFAETSLSLLQLPLAHNPSI